MSVESYLCTLTPVIHLPNLTPQLAHKVYPTMMDDSEVRDNMSGTYCTGKSKFIECIIFSLTWLPLLRGLVISPSTGPVYIGGNLIIITRSRLSCGNITDYEFRHGVSKFRYLWIISYTLRWSHAISRDTVARSRSRFQMGNRFTDISVQWVWFILFMLSDPYKRKQCTRILHAYFFPCDHNDWLFNSTIGNYTSFI